MKIIEMVILTLLFGLVLANLLLKVKFYGTILVKRYFPEFWNFGVLLYVGTAPQTVIGLHSVWVRVMSGIRRFWFGNVSVDTTQFGAMSDLIWSWINLESLSGRPTHAELRLTRPLTLPDKTDTTSFFCILHETYGMDFMILFNRKVSFLIHIWINNAMN